jgi:uncharacterized protein (TIGR03067 family)
MRQRIVFVVAVSFLIAAGAPQDEAAKQDMKQFEGTWRTVSVEREGKPAPPEAIGQGRLVLDGNKFTFTFAGETTRGTYQVDPTKKPKALDILPMDGPDKGKTVLGIYELEGAMHKTCLAAPGQPRPTSFTSKPGSGNTLYVMKREKP